MKAVLLIGGFGTRLRPLTLARPKALLPVLNRPFLAYQLELLAEAGVTDVMLACGKFMRPWQKDFKALAPRGVKIHFAFEPKPLGTGGAIRFAYDHLKKVTRPDASPVLIFNGDVFFELPVKRFVDFHLNHASAATIALTRVEDPSRFGLVERDDNDRVTQFLEKSKPPFRTNYINAGAYAFNPKAIERIPAGQVVSVERDVFPSMLVKGDRLFGFSMGGYWNDIGTHASYLAAHKHLLTEKNRWTQSTFFTKRTRLNAALSRKNLSIDGFVSFGKNVSLGKNCRVTDSVLMDGCRVDEGAQISGSILGRKCRIGHHAVVGPGSVLADGTVVLPYNKS